MFNIGLLIKTLSIQTKSYDDDDMVYYITSFLKKHKLRFKRDSYGNIYVIKGKAKSYPCIVSHIDTVHQKIDKSKFKIYKANSILFAMNTETGKQTGIGGDDKVGVYVALQALTDLDVVKVVFFRNEEVGKLGSKHSIKNNKGFYKNCNFVLQCDRKGGSDFITTSSGIKMTTDKFMEDVDPLLKKYNFKEERGLSTDVDALVRGGVGVCCVNISSGYYRPHSDSEIVKIEEAKNTYNFTIDIINTLGTERYDHTYTEPVYSYNSGNGNYNSNFSNYGTPISTDNIFYQKSIVSLADKTISSGIYDRFFTIKVPKSLNAEEERFVLKNRVELIDIKESECKYCKDANCITYYPLKDLFMCKSCGDFKSQGDDQLSEVTEYYKNLKVTDDKTTFVYNKLGKYWLKEKDANWSSFTLTYTPSSWHRDYR